MSGKRYHEEFKTEAVRQVVEHGHSIVSVGTRLDITTHSLCAPGKKVWPCFISHQNAVRCPV